MTEPTPFPDLNGVLEELVAGVQRALPQNLRGVYLLGSFALGDADEHSDVDFLVATERALSAREQEELQALHGRIFDLPVAWAQHLEGSYVPAAVLRRLDRERRPLFFLDNGARELVWHAHCNTALTRWTLREHGVALAGASPASVALPVDPDDLRAEARRKLQETADWAREARGELTRWEQPYMVLSCCRMRYTLAHGRLASKREAGRWALEALEERWHPLIRAALEDRADPWQRVHQTAPAAMVAETTAFATAATQA
ncbi:MAG TPA: aminoglycoside adenylyltransferase domain-containing protein [Gaiellaceae bacterium]|nr:aminoglycoside adenylyltransferase domain-containing protein [Gaiellaceae bacterium]